MFASDLWWLGRSDEDATVELRRDAVLDRARRSRIVVAVLFAAAVFVCVVIAVATFALSAP